MKNFVVCKQWWQCTVVNGFNKCLAIVMRTSSNFSVVLDTKKQRTTLCICKSDELFDSKLDAFTWGFRMNPRLEFDGLRFTACEEAL